MINTKAILLNDVISDGGRTSELLTFHQLNRTLNSINQTRHHFLAHFTEVALTFK